jgi:hypothetical protein
MARPRKMTETETAHDRRLESDRVRAQAYRDRAVALGRPSPSMTDRAITKAIRDAWGARLDAVAGPDRNARAAAMREGVDLIEVGSRAVAWLTRFGRADPVQARQMVLSRMRPVAPRDASAASA